MREKLRRKLGDPTIGELAVSVGLTMLAIVVFLWLRYGRHDTMVGTSHAAVLTVVGIALELVVVRVVTALRHRG